MDSEKYNVLVVEDDVIIAQLIKKYLIKSGHQVLDIVFDSERAIEKASLLRPDLILLDINILGDRDGIDVAKIIEEEYNIPYIFITALSDNLTLKRAKQLSPVGYIIKPFKESDLNATIIIGMSNYRKSSSHKSLTLEFFNKNIEEQLTEKEFDILIRMAKGFTNNQMAYEDGLSLNTIKWHTQNIYSKLDVKNRTAATEYMMRITNLL